ncbi:3-hydroxyacyl-CoA dehydrogenase [Colwellia psychrerythraea]|uniref:3-hydroxyacyl-CoA dehydrogenase n=1 Tax=Colwellia psychrerythraea TaxID=28229 RepID=A0A1Y5EM80_COLPS|nr:3-hydroxyacyl-CoA dehydrogenase [Colwellia psychrerythraea]
MTAPVLLIPTTPHADNIAIINIDNPPVNALSHAVRQGVVDAIAQAEQNENINAIVIYCQGKTFIAGADIKEFGKTPKEPHLPDVLQRINQCNKPIIAALFGNVLGGGFELALACHYRIAVKGTKLGLPEVNLGLIPGAGGTQLLPRIAGVELALTMITSGKPQKVEQLDGYGIIDQLISADNTKKDHLLNETITFAKALLEQKQTSKIITQQPMALNSEEKQAAKVLCQQFRDKLAKKSRGQQAPQSAVNSIENAFTLPLNEATVKEREYFLACRGSAQSRAMRHAFFAEKTAAKLMISGETKPTPAEIKSVAVIGAGTMGGGIAMCFANAGISVTLLEMNQSNLAKGINAIANRYQQAQTRGIISKEKVNQCMALITGTCDYQDLAQVDLVVEAAFETMAVKQQIFSQLDKVCKPEAILASNTSYLDIDEIAKATTRPEKVVGMHFFSPANIMKLLEVVATKYTDSQTLTTAMTLGKKMGKISVAVKVCYGFVGNRMYACYGREANMLLLEGATPQQVDKAMVQWGMAMGPLAVNDMSGIDIGYKARQANTDRPDDPCFFAAADTLVEAGRLGQKTHAGFYQYDEQTNKRSPDDAAVNLIRANAAKLGIKQRSDISDEEIQQRLIFALINEGAYILEQGIATRASDIDAIWLNGYGFPRYLGGPMCYADEIGLEKVVATIKEFQQKLGSNYWQVAPLLENLVAENKNLTR